MMKITQIPHSIQIAFDQFSQSSKISQETLWRTAFQAYLYRSTFEPKIIVASFDDNDGGWNAHVIDFQPSSKFQEQLGAAVSRPAGEFPIQAVFRYGKGGSSKQLSANISLMVSGELVWEFDADRYSEQDAERIASQFLVFLDNLASDFAQACAKISLLTQEQVRIQTVEWNETELPYEADTALHTLFERRAAENPFAIAVVFGQIKVNYYELNTLSNQLAHALREEGLKPGGMVGLFMERDIDLVVSMLGVMKAGGVFVPLDPRYPSDALGRILANVELDILLTRTSLETKFPVSIRKTVQFDLVNFGMSLPDVPPPTKTAPDSPAFVLFTSGSTGTPKGVLHTHQNILARFAAIQDFLQMGSGDGFSQSSPVSSIDAIDELLFPVLYGAATVIVPYEEVVDPRLLLNALRVGEVTHILLVPSLLRVILNNLGEDDAHLKTLKACIIGGEALTRSLAEAFLQKLPHTKLYNFYGLTEGDVSRIEVAPNQLEDSPSSVGRPIANTKVYLLDEFSNLVPPGIPGEICVSGEGLFAGYLNRPDLDKKVFFANPFSSDQRYLRVFRTGDFGMYLPDGRLEYLGRRDRMVKVRGFRVELDEIENVLKSYPGVKECLVVAREVDGGRSDALVKQKRLIAYFLPEDGMRISLRELQGYLAARLADFSMPQALVQIDQFPLSPNGKVDVKALPNPAEIRRQNTDNHIAPRGPVEAKLAELWEELLQLRPIGMDENFFDLGGDSLSAIDLMVSIEKAFDRSLPISILLQHPTIAELAEVVQSDVAASPAGSLVPIQTKGSLPPLFCIHADGGVMFYYEFARRMDDQPIYGIQARGLAAGSRPHSSVEEMAADYISEIKTVQPKGPYHFCAFSLGGVVALEMARQLRGRGEQVAFVGLLDAYAPGYPQLLPQKNLLQYKMSVHMGTMRLHGLQGKINYLYRRLKTRSKKVLTGMFGSILVTLGIPLPQTIRYYYVADVLNDMVDAHKPQTCPGTVTLFRASIQPENIVPDLELGWSKHVEGGVKIVEVTGTHNSIIKDPHLSILVKAIQDELLQSQANA